MLAPEALTALRAHTVDGKRLGPVPFAFGLMLHAPQVLLSLAHLPLAFGAHTRPAMRNEVRRALELAAARAAPEPDALAAVRVSAQIIEPVGVPEVVELAQECGLCRVPVTRAVVVSQPDAAAAQPLAERVARDSERVRRLLLRHAGLEQRERVADVLLSPAHRLTPYQSRLRRTASPDVRASPGMRLPRLSLHILCAACTLAGSIGEPPLETGTISSTSKLHGSPAGSE